MRRRRSRPGAHRRRQCGGVLARRNHRRGVRVAIEWRWRSARLAQAGARVKLFEKIDGDGDQQAEVCAFLFMLR